MTSELQHFFSTTLAGRSSILKHIISVLSHSVVLIEALRNCNYRAEQGTTYKGAFMTWLLLFIFDFMLFWASYYFVQDSTRALYWTSFLNMSHCCEQHKYVCRIVEPVWGGACKQDWRYLYSTDCLHLFGAHSESKDFARPLQCLIRLCLGQSGVWPTMSTVGSGMCIHLVVHLYHQ